MVYGMYLGYGPHPFLPSVVDRGRRQAGRRFRRAGEEHSIQHTGIRVFTR